MQMGNIFYGFNKHYIASWLKRLLSIKQCSHYVFNAFQNTFQRVRPEFENCGKKEEEYEFLLEILSAFHIKCNKETYFIFENKIKRI